MLFMHREKHIIKQRAWYDSTCAKGMLFMWRMSGRRELSHKCVWFEVLVGNSRRDIEVFEKFGTISQEMGM